MKPITLIACLVLILVRNFAIAQDELTIAEEKRSKEEYKIINVQSLDGKGRNVHIVPDYVHRVLRVSCLKDTLAFYFWQFSPEVRLLNNNFIEIKYELNGGSNLGLGNVIIICVNHNKLHDALHILRYADWESEDVMKYNVKISFNESRKSAFRLNIAVDDYVNSKTEPKTNYLYHSENILSFDRSKNIFYSLKENIDDTLKVRDPKTDQITKQAIHGNFPTILLGKETYYYINDKWYELYEPGTGTVLNIYRSRAVK